MLQTATIINFASAASERSLLNDIRQLISNSPHLHEQTGYQFIADLEALYAEGTIGLAEFALIAGKAGDVLEFFRQDIFTLRCAPLAQRASIIHQLCCAMLQAIRLLRPDLCDNPLLSETAYNLYCYRIQEDITPDCKPNRLRPIKGRYW